MTEHTEADVFSRAMEEPTLNDSERYAGILHQPFFPDGGSLAVIERIFFEEPTLDTRSIPLTREVAQDRLRNLQKTVRILIDTIEGSQMREDKARVEMEQLNSLAKIIGLTPRERWNISKHPDWKMVVLNVTGNNKYDSVKKELDRQS